MGLFRKAKSNIYEATAKEDTKLILFEGTEKGIYVYHFVMQLALNRPEADILVIDNSYSQDLFEAIPRDGKIGNIYGTSVLSQRRMTPDAFKKFDYVVVYLGECIDQEYILAANYTFVLSDYSIKSKKYLNAFTAPDTTDVQFIFINKVAPKVTEKLMLQDMTNYNVKPETELIVIELAEEDLVGYISWLYEGDRKFTSMSKEYTNAISAIATAIASGKKSIPESNENTEDDKEEDK